MDTETRKAMIEELSSILDKAEALNKEFSYPIERYHLYGDATILPASQAAYHLVSALTTARDTLIRNGWEWVRDYVTDWYQDRIELDEHTDEIPVYESITYTGKDEWTIIINTSTHLREKVVVQSDTTYAQLYSVDPA